MSKKGLFFFLALLLASQSLNAKEGDLPPIAAQDAGYIVKTFDSTFTAAEVDFKDTRQSGFKWYVGRFFKWKPTPEDYFGTHEDGALLIKTGFGNSNMEIATAAKAKGSRNWLGRAFGGGGYFEAELAFDPQDVRKPDRKGWPSFWAMSLEHLAQLPQKQWEGQGKGYEHFIEVDIFEYLFEDSEEDRYIYSATMHDWHGVWKQTCPQMGFCDHRLLWKQSKRRVPKGTDFTSYHKYGFLWIPATEKTKGSAQFFFDSKPIGVLTTWSLYENQPPSPYKKAWTMGILDRHHLVLALGTGIDQPMRVRSVKVWQKSDDRNWVQ
ncbi:MAG: hypothetical protein FWF24_01175 [Alphaproteobacteria bacterium]|nr:hypothetical protein [Alphaproteobacteria bacterium]